MKKIITSLLLLAFCHGLSAQNPSLTILSESEDPFYVYLDGVKQNMVSTKNIRIVDLKDKSYGIRIVFDNIFQYNVEFDSKILQDSNGRNSDMNFLIVKSGSIDYSVKLGGNTNDLPDDLAIQSYEESPSTEAIGSSEKSESSSPKE